VGTVTVRSATRATGRSPWLTLATYRDVEWNAPLSAHLGWEVMAEDEVQADARLLAVRAEEAEHGLDPDARVFMRRRV
jgi:hypothetical protein